jgi:hypothetical protein
MGAKRDPKLTYLVLLIAFKLKKSMMPHFGTFINAAIIIRCSRIIVERD